MAGKIDGYKELDIIWSDNDLDTNNVHGQHVQVYKT